MNRRARGFGNLRRVVLTHAGVLGAVALLTGPLAASDVPMAFGTRGGDAWQFHKLIDITVSRRRCDQVAIVSPTTSLVLAPEHGHVRARIALQPGNNSITAKCREHGALRHIAHQNWYVPLRNVPTASIRLKENGTSLALDAYASKPAPFRAAAIARYEWRPDDRNPAPLAGLPATGPRLDLTASAPDGEYRITLEVTDEAGRSDESIVLLRSQGGTLRKVDPDHDHPAWIDRAVIYGVVPWLFGPRGLADVTAQLDQLSELGITALWLSPIMESPPGDFGYAVTDYFRLRRHLGTEDDLRDLVRAAHARGMRVILDFVPNHLSDRNAYFTDTIAHARSSTYFDFFSRDRAGRAEHYFDWTNLENLNYANPEVQRLVIEGFAYWIRNFDVDGFRVDAAWGPRQRAPDFWPRWRKELKRIKPDLLLLAEASARDSYYRQHGFDAAYDWTEKLGDWAWRGPFDDPKNTARDLRSAIASTAEHAMQVFRFLENNDTGARFVSRYGQDRTRLAAAMLLTLPGLPCLYTGQEVGAGYEPYKETRAIAWDDVDGLRSWYRRLIALRRDYPALRSHDLRFLDVAPEANVLAYLRRAEKPSDSILVILNYGAEVVVPLLTDEPLMHSRKFIDLLTGDKIALDGPTVAIAGQSVRILKAE
jgi:cyclomaltodextrinase